MTRDEALALHGLMEKTAGEFASAVESLVCALPVQWNYMDFTPQQTVLHCQIKDRYATVTRDLKGALLADGTRWKQYDVRDFWRWPGGTGRPKRPRPSDVHEEGGSGEGGRSTRQKQSEQRVGR